MLISETVLNGILHLFALKSAGYRGLGPVQARKIVLGYLTDSLGIFNPGQYISLFEGFCAFYDPPPAPEELISRTTEICNGLKGHIPRQELYFVLLRFLELSKPLETEDDEMLLCQGHAMGEAFGIEADLIPDMLAFIRQDFERFTDNHLVIASRPAPDDLACKWLFSPHFSGQAIILHIRDMNTVFVTPHEESKLTLNGIPIPVESFCPFPPGGILGDSRSAFVYYAQILHAISPRDRKNDLIFTASNADFRFPGSDNGLHNFSFTARGGEMIGIMGGSGVGKSTLVNILNGSLPPLSGQIRINGFDLYQESRELEGVVGFIPQDDLLFDELTVYENLYYSTRLCLSHHTPAQISRRVEELLAELNQLETKNLKVGSPLEKTISGGQRKRLNIALELIREPSVLFVDEPTSGLSSADSLNVIGLLKEQSTKGRLILVIIHQPSSEIFKMFDQLWLMDKGGRPIYTGNPIDALVYFREAVWQAGTQECLCPKCGNVNPEQLFDIIEMKQLDDKGYTTDQRRFSPEQWHSRHLAARQETSSRHEKKGPGPAKALSRPGLAGQFSIFFTRNLLTRLANRQYLGINLLEAPFLAWIIAMVTRFEPSVGYSFADNHNIPVYFFMSVIVASFMGLSVSAEEIIRDRSVLSRERFLHLSWFSYINAKVIYLAMVSLIQTGLYTLVGNSILGIPGFFLPTWLTLFSCSVYASLIGLNISAAFKTVVTIYIMIPLLLVPQIILGGMTVSFDDLISRDAPHNRVPVIANLMPSRWGFEALITRQFSSNPFQRPLNAVDRQVNQADYMLNCYIPELKSCIDYPFLSTGNANPDDKQKTLSLVQKEFTSLTQTKGIDPALPESAFRLPGYTRKAATVLKNTLKQLTQALHKERLQLDQARRALQSERADSLGGSEGLRALETRYRNKRIVDLVRNRDNLDDYRITRNRIVRLSDPIFTRDLSAFGGAPFMAGSKQLGTFLIPTFAFNLGVLWLTTLFFYGILYWHLLSRLFNMVAALTKALSGRTNK